MNRDQAKQLLPIIQAFADGKKIQFYSETTEQWVDAKNPTFTFSPNRYRISESIESEKPKTIKIESRRYLYYYSGYRILVCDSRAEAGDISTSPWFVRWIDSDWITEEVEINHD